MDKQVTDGSNTGSRMPGKMILKQRIEDLHRMAASLQVIHDMLPEKPTPEQDAAIYQFSVDIYRG